VIYADANFDVSRAIFSVQEFLALLNTVLLVILWQLWMFHLQERRTERIFNGETPLQRAFDYRGIACLGRTFVHWQICSLVLAAAFFPYTHFFWGYIFRAGDSRYIVHALIVHAVWLVSWILLSLPLVVTWLQWREVRARCLEALVSESSLGRTQIDETVSKLLSDDPVPGWNVVGSVGAGIALFVGPVVHTMFS
jgi:hypothetical protein